MQGIWHWILVCYVYFWIVIWLTVKIVLCCAGDLALDFGIICVFLNSDTINCENRIVLCCVGDDLALDFSLLCVFLSSDMINHENCVVLRKQFGVRFQFIIYRVFLIVIWLTMNTMLCCAGDLVLDFDLLCGVFLSSDMINHENQLFLWETVSQRDKLRTKSPHSYLLFNLLGYLTRTSNAFLGEIVSYNKLSMKIVLCCAGDLALDL